MSVSTSLPLSALISNEDGETKHSIIFLFVISPKCMEIIVKTDG
jgi:hypothetical protein